MSHFLISWGGNKRKEYNHFKQFIPISNINNIIEPFCGTSAISFNLWLEHGNKFNYYLNDLDKDLFKIYEIIKNENLDFIFDKLNDVKSKSNTYESFKITKNEWKDDNDIYKYMILKKISLYGSLRTLAYNRTIDVDKSFFKKNKNNIKFQEFLKSPNVFISNDDWYDCYNRHKDNNQSLFIFDPPYLDSNNIDFYKKECRNLNIYDKLDDIKNDKATSIFIIEKIDKIEKLFKDWIISIEYDKMYSVKKKKTIHIMYSNR